MEAHERPRLLQPTRRRAENEQIAKPIRGLRTARFALLSYDFFDRRQNNMVIFERREA